ncbi:MAG: hypothetical protein R3C56_35150 [Pirellulaceae bacterium]
MRMRVAIDANRILGTLATAARVKPRLRKGTIPHSEFGWPAGSYSRIETPHFMLTTRGEPRESIELAHSMEAFTLCGGRFSIPYGHLQEC